MKALLLVLLFVSFLLAGEKKDTTSFVVCICDTVIIVKTYADTTLVLKLDTINTGKARIIKQEIK